jgi:phage terminase large subunit-like protein
VQSVQEALGTLSQRLLAARQRPTLLRYTPHAKQRDFHSSPAQSRLYIGGNRAGKTTGGACESLYRLRGVHPYQRVPDPPIRGRAIGTDFPNGVEQIIIPKLKEWLVPSDLINGSWEDSYRVGRSGERVLNFVNGSVLQFMSADSELRKHAGTSQHFVWIDEECPRAIWTENRARIVDVGGCMWMTMTAVDGQTWSYDDLYVPGLGIDGPRDPSIHVTQVAMDENPFLSDEEIAKFLSGLSEEDQAARVRGDYAATGGLIFKNFSRELLVVPPRRPPAEWPIYASMDHGLNAPTAWLWHAVGPQGQILTFHEEYAAELTVPSWADRVLRYESELRRTPEYRVGDPSIRNRQQANGAIVSIQGEYLKHGVIIMLGSNDVPAGINRLRRYLERPGMWQITADCTQLVRQMHRYRWRSPISTRTKDRTNPYEEPIKKDDHAVDATRYFVMSRPDLEALGPEADARAEPARPDIRPAINPWERVVPAMSQAETGDRDTLRASEWEINESIGGIW